VQAQAPGVAVQQPVHLIRQRLKITAEHIGAVKALKLQIALFLPEPVAKGRKVRHAQRRTDKVCHEIRSILKRRP